MPGSPLVELKVGDEVQSLSWDEWEARVREGRVQPTTLVRFEPATGEDFAPAGELEMFQSLQDHAGVIAWQARFVDTAPLLTALLVGVQIRLWWAARFSEDVYWMALRDLTVFAPPIYEDGQVWRIFTMGFTQVDALHIAMNMLWLFYCGWNLERALGRVNLLTLYMGSVVSGSMFSMLGGPESPSLGASGGVFGLVAASIVFGFVRPSLLPEKGRRLFGWALLPYLVLMFLSGLVQENTDNWGHLGGLVAGTVLGVLLDPPQLQRRPWWNAGWQGLVVAITTVILLVLGLAGPRVHPLQDSETARWIKKPESFRQPLQLDSALAHDVPVGWKPGRTAARDLGFESPAGHRVWSVSEREEDRPLSADVARETWIAGLLAEFPDADITKHEDVDLAGQPALGASVALREPGFPERILDYRVATRGVWALEAVWQVETGSAVRLAPLERRLRRRVVWSEPASLASARIHFEHDSTSPKARDAWATELLRVGRVDEAAELRIGLVEQLPQVVAWWSGLLDLLAWHPEAVDDPERWWQAALDAHPTGAMAAHVVRSLEAAGRDEQAVGLLDIAWVQMPGERSLRKLRREKHLSIEFADGEPWDLLYDPATGGERDPVAVDARRRLPLSVESAGPRGAAIRAEERAVIDATVAALREGDVDTAVARAGWFREGTTALDPEQRAKVHRDLHDAATTDHPAKWIPSEVVVAARANPPPPPPE